MDSPQQNPLRFLLHTVLLATAYCIAGKLGLLLAIPPGFTTTVWPASGIALAVILLFGYRHWVGVMLGSIVLNLTASDNTGSTALQSYLSVAGLGFGATMQAVAGAYMVKNFVKFPSKLQAFREIIILLILGGPVSCLISATVGSASIFHTLTPGEFALNWVTWWIGDSTGVIVFAPLTYMLMAPSNTITLQRKKIVSLPLITLFILATLLFSYSKNMEQASLESKFLSVTTNETQKLKQSIKVSHNILHSLEALYSSSNEVTYAEFKQFSQHIFESHQGLRALSWIPRVTASNQAQYLKSGRQINPDFKFTEPNTNDEMVPASAASVYYPVLYVSPLAGNENTLGFNLGSNPALLKTLNKAAETQGLVATPPINLVQDYAIPHLRNYLLVHPLYINKTDTSTAKPQQENLLGYIASTIAIDTLIHSALTDIGHDYHLQISDNSSPNNLVPIFSGTRIATTAKTWEASIEFADRSWLLQYTPSNKFLLANRSWAVWLILVSSLMFIGLIGLFLLTLTAQTEAIKQAVINKTEEIKLAQSELELILNSTADGIYGVNCDGKTTFANRAALNMVGYSIEEMTGTQQHSLIHHTYANGEPYPSSECKIYRSLKTGRSISIDDEIFWRKDGTSFPVEYSSTPIIKADGKIHGAVVVFKDITERHQAEVERKNLINELARTNEELEKFAYVASHDLKAPLRAITHLTDWIEEDISKHLGTEGQENFILLRKRIKRMEKLLNDLLEYSRLGRKGHYSEELISTNEIFEDILSILPVPKHIKINVKSTSSEIQVPRMPIQQILQNIIDNAVKYNDKDQGHIEIQVDDLFDPEFYIFSIKDNGAGIAEEYHEKVFEMFQTLQPRDKIEGSGMGLAYVKKAVEAYGGSIHIKSTAGIGSIFMLSWPKPKEQINERYASNH